jgi:hypothetical protein
MMRTRQAPIVGIVLLSFVCSLAILPSGRSTGLFGGSEDSGLGNYAGAPFLISLSVRGGYDDNVNTSSISPNESWFTNLGASVTYAFGDPRTRFDLAAGGGVTYYFDRIGSDDYDTNFYLGFSLTHKATPRLTLSTTAYATYQEEPDFSLFLGLNRRSGNYFYTRDKFTVTYLWTPRFSTATSYTLGVIRYDDSAIGAFENRFENTVGNEFRFLLYPTTTVVGEYRFQIVTFDSIARDSMSHFALAGFDQRFSSRLDSSLRGGIEFRSYEENGDSTSPYFEGALNYALSKDSTVAWTARYAIEESDVLLNRSRTTFRTGLRAKYSFTQRISGTLGAYFQNDAYDAINTPMAVSPAFDENSVDVAVGLRYAINRYFAVEVGCSHTEVFSDSVFREYSRNRVFAGVNLAF